MRLSADTGAQLAVLDELVQDRVAAEPVGRHAERLLRYLRRLACPQFLDDSVVGRLLVWWDSASGQPQFGDLGAPRRLGRVEGSGALRPVVVKRDGEVPPLQCLLASGVVGDDVVGQVLEIPVMRLLAQHLPGIAWPNSAAQAGAVRPAASARVLA